MLATLAPTSGATAMATTRPGESPRPSGSPFPETPVPETPLPSASGTAESEHPSDGTGTGGTETGSGSGGFGSPVGTWLDDGGVVRTVTFGALGIVGLFLLGLQLLGRRNRGR
jgi:hypothetical protein